MTPLYAFSLIPVLSVALLLCFTLILRHRNSWGLAAYCAATALWTTNLLLTYFPQVSSLALRTTAIGAIVVAGYLHAAYDFTDQRRYHLVWFAYATAIAITVIGAIFPGLLYDPTRLSAGALFWPTMALAMVAATVPMWHLFTAYRRADGRQRNRVFLLLLAGVIGYIGAWSNAIMLAHGHALPYGMFLVLGSLMLLTRLVQDGQTPMDRRLLERSLLYSSLTAFFSAAFLFGVLVFMSETAEPLLREYRLAALALLVLAAVAFEPLRQHGQEFLGRLLLKDHTHAGELAEALAIQEQRADQAQRLAELGAFTSAIAHEVRNPLGVISAYIRVLERQDVAPEVLTEMRDQIERASTFLDDLLNYGRPRPLELRMVGVVDTSELAVSQTCAGLGEHLPADVEWLHDHQREALTLEADQAQLLQVLIILLENALLAVLDTPTPPEPGHKIRIASRLHGDRVRWTVEDSGPGIDPAIRPRLFEPFVTGRKREGSSHGTGLGLAIALAICERHGGTLTAHDSDLGGARFEIELPRVQAVLAAAALSRTAE